MPGPVRPVYVHETCEFFINAEEAAKSLGVDHSDLCKYIKGLKTIKWLEELNVSYCSERLCRFCKKVLTELNRYRTADNACKECAHKEKRDGYERRKIADPILHKFTVYKQNNICNFTLNQLRDLWKFQEERCSICDDDLLLGGMHLDHIIPKSKGGKSIINNIQLLCKKCNIGKWDYYQEEYIEHCKQVTENH